MKKITRKKALSLALAGLMLAPSVPIQSFAQGSGANTASVASTTQTPRPPQHCWAKFLADLGNTKYGDSAMILAERSISKNDDLFIPPGGYYYGIAYKIDNASLSRLKEQGYTDLEGVIKRELGKFIQQDGNAILDGRSLTYRGPLSTSNMYRCSVGSSYDIKNNNEFNSDSLLIRRKNSTKTAYENKLIEMKTLEEKLKAFNTYSPIGYNFKSPSGSLYAVIDHNGSNFTIVYPHASRRTPNQPSEDFIDYVYSPSKVTYPEQGAKGEYWYEYQGMQVPPTQSETYESKIKEITTTSDDDIKGAIENLPEGSTVDIVSKPERTAYTPEIKELVVKPGEKADLTQAVTNPKEGVKIEEKTPVDTNKVGTQTGAITITLPAETKNAKAKITFKDQSTKEVDVPIAFKEASKDYDVTVNVKEAAVKVTLNYVDETGKTVATKEMSVESGSKIKLAEIPELFGYKLISTEDIAVSEDGQAVTVNVKDLNAEIKSLEDQLNAKKGELSDLEKQLAAEKAKGEQDTAKIAELEKAINDKKAEIDKLNKQIGDLDAVIKQLQDKLNGLKGNLENANKELAKSKADLENLKKELEAKITDLNGQIADKDAKGKDLEKQLADEKAKGDQDATKIAELEKAIKDNNDAKDALNKEKDALAKELADKEAKIAKLVANAKKLEGDVKDLEQKVKDLVDGKAVDAETMKNLQDQLDKAKAENQKLSDDLKALQDDLNAKIKELEDQVKTKDQELADLKEQLSAEKAKADQDANKIAELEKVIAEKEAEIGKLNDKVGSQSELIKALEAKLDEMKKDLADANKNLLDSKSELDKLKKDLADKIAALNGKIAEKEAKGKDLEKQLADEKGKGDQDAAKIAELEKAIKENNDAKDVLNKEKEGLAKELADKEAKIAELEANAKKLKDNVKDLEAKIKDLIDGKSVDASALKKAEDALAQAKADNAKLADEIKKLQDSLKTEKAASAEKDKELSKLREEAKANHDANLSELKKELKKELDKADKVDRKRLSEQENKKLDEVIKKANDIFAKKDAKDDEVKQAIKDLKEILKPYENFIFDDKHINGLLGKNIKSLKEFIDKVEKAIGGTLIEEETISKDGEYTALKYVFMIDSNKYAQATNKDTKIYKMDVSPFIRSNKTMLPLRYVANVLGADVNWNDRTRTATFTKDGIEAKINIDEGKTIKVGGKSVELSAKPAVVQNRIFVPLTDISKVFEVTNGNTDDGINQDIEWNKDNRTVTVHIAR